MIQDITGILPPNQFTQGNPYAFLQDIKNAASYTEKKDSRGTIFSVNIQEVYGRLLVRNQSNANYPTTKHPAEPSVHTIWGTIQAMIYACETETLNTNCFIELNYMYIEADSTIKDDIVPTGIRLSDGVLTFNDWGANTEFFTPTVAISLDDTKIVYAIHLVNSGQGIINMDEIKSWIEFASVSDKNVKLMTHFEYQQLTQSAAYNSEVV